MAISKPFHRTVRDIKPMQNSGYSGWAYIRDPLYAENPSHYTRALLLILDDLRQIFEYVEPSDECKAAFSYRIHALLMRTCIEVEANFKAIFGANTTPKPNFGVNFNIGDYRKIDVSHHLSAYKVLLPIWNGVSPEIQPFAPWLHKRGQNATAKEVQLPWYAAYNHSKHDRQKAFKHANLWNLIEAVAALVVVISAQFKSEDFNAGPDLLSVGSGPHPFDKSIGYLFRIKYPNDWSDAERYEFDWSDLKNEPDRFEKFDYNSVCL